MASSLAPAELGFRMPAEWERQDAVWLSWPHNRRTWPGSFRPIPGIFAAVVTEISRREPVRINAAAPLQARARALLVRAGAEMANVTFYNHPTDDAWCRDHGPIFVRSRRTGEVALTDWSFNAWGGKYPHGLDNAIPPRIGRALGLRRFENPMVLEGGSIDVNGKGLLLTTEACLLNPNRNPQLGRGDIERNLREYLGVRTIIWLGDGIVGDDTDGHVDDLTRFFREDGIVTAVEPRRRDANHRVLATNLERLRGLRTPSGSRFTIAELPMPEPCAYRGTRLPASYANFLIINDAVLVPSFRQPRRDRQAMEVIGACFPGREVVPLDCLELVRGLGTLHCLSQQQPASRP
jgi:agmatine deiminase